MILQLPFKELPEAWKKVLCETLGTFYLVLTVSMTSQQSIAHFAPIAIGFQLMTQVFAYGYICGGHFNPSVSAGIALSSLMHIQEMLRYWVAQLIGAISATLLSWFIIGDVTEFAAPEPAAETPIGVFRAFLCEMVFTFCLVSVVLNVACSRQKDNSHYGLAIGMTVLSAAYAVGNISGGAFNPAVATGLELVRCFAGTCHTLRYLPMFWGAGMCGAFFAAVVFRLIHPIEKAHLPLNVNAKESESTSLLHNQE